MARLIVGLVLLLYGAPSFAAPDAVDRWAPEIAEASARFQVPEDWIRRVMRVESGGRTKLSGRPIVSSAGAMGLMQLMPRTWAEMRAAHGLGPDPHHPRDNILAGTAYLRHMHDRFGYPGLFAAYNAGPARYAEHLSGEARLPKETRLYLKRLGVPKPFPVATAPGRRLEAGLFAISRREADRAQRHTRKTIPGLSDLLVVLTRESLSH